LKPIKKRMNLSMTLPLIHSFRSALEKKPQIGLGIMYPAPGIIERIGPDWDWIWIDGQHGTLDYGDIVAAVRACNLIKRPAVVRVPDHEPGFIGKALDTGAEGVMLPMVNSAEEAQDAVKASKFAPLGARSYGGRRTIDLDGRGYANPGNLQPLLICQIETSKGLASVEDIAAVDGVDALFFGPDDMTLEAGLPMDVPPPAEYFTEAKRAVADAAQRNNIITGGVFTSPEALREGIRMGYHLMVATADVVLLAGGSRQKSEEMKNAR
jgi:4-hydroxy-2-oxoheptanedioate aldolase